MKKLEHENVIRLHEVIDDPNDDRLFLSKKINFKEISLVLDYAEKGQLLEWDEESNSFIINDISNDYFSENRLREIFREIIKGLYYCN